MCPFHALSRPPDRRNSSHNRAARVFCKLLDEPLCLSFTLLHIHQIRMTEDKHASPAYQGRPNRAAELKEDQVIISLLLSLPGRHDYCRPIPNAPSFGSRKTAAGRRHLQTSVLRFRPTCQRVRCTFLSSILKLLRHNFEAGVAGPLNRRRRKQSQSKQPRNITEAHTTWLVVPKAPKKKYI